jgi:hypothetical protein
MKKVLQYAGFVAIGLAAGAAVTVATIVLGAGVFWLYVFGDDPWPSAAQTLLTVAAFAAGAATAIALPVLVARSRRAST